MKICAGIVLFHPETERLKQNIDAIFPQIDKLILVNNSPEDFERIKSVTASLETDNCGKIEWINNNENLGIATALNQMLTAADSAGFKWLLTLDQDSVCSDGYVDKLYEVARNFNDAAMVSPRVIERGKVWEDDVKPREKDRDEAVQTDVEDVRFCITSGTLTNIEAIKRVGGWNERLFIDEVDREICIKLKYKGFRMLRVNSAELHHEFGIEHVRRRILFMVYEYRNYSPFRVYYQMRNLVYMVRKYGADYKPHPAWRLIRPFFTFFVKFIFEPQRLKRLSAFVRGYSAGLVMKL